MKGLRGKLLFAWLSIGLGYERILPISSFFCRQCTDTGFLSLEKKEKPLFLNELKKLRENKDKLLWQKGRYSSSNTLMIDDKLYKALLNPPNTAIFPESYNADGKDDNALDPKGELGQFLDGLADAEDVRAFVEKHPFGQPAVTTSHSDRLYYSKVVCHFRRE